jgi:hypothetical protein
MKRPLMIGLLVAVSVLSSAFAASPTLKPRGKPGAGYMVLFDPSSMATVEGTVVRVHQVPSPKVWLTSVHALVRTKHGDVSVNLGPSWFLDNQELHLTVDDRISVTGSRVKANGVESLIAVTVTRNEEVLQLRATDGTPVWVAWRVRTQAGASR